MSAMAQRDMVLWLVDGNTRQALDGRMLGLARSERGARSDVVAAKGLVHRQEQSSKSMYLVMACSIRPGVLSRRVRRVRGQANSSLSASGWTSSRTWSAVLEAVLRAA